MSNRIVNLRGQVQVLKHDKEILEHRVQGENMGDRCNQAVEYFKCHNLQDKCLQKYAKIEQFQLFAHELEEVLLKFIEE